MPVDRIELDYSLHFAVDVTKLSEPDRLLDPVWQARFEKRANAAREAFRAALREAMEEELGAELVEAGET